MMLFLKRKKKKEKIGKKIRCNISFNETFLVAALNICEMNLNHRNNLKNISKKFFLVLL